MHRKNEVTAYIPRGRATHMDNMSGKDYSDLYTHKINVQSWGNLPIVTKQKRR